MRTVVLIIISQLIAVKLFAQTGTYRISTETGASCNIAIKQRRQQLSGNVFAWWGDGAGRHGVFSGSGKIQHNACLLISNNDPDCKISLTFKPGFVTAAFNDCMNSNLPEDFSGRYQKITDYTPGIFKVCVDKIYFYKSAGDKNPMKAYLLRGDVVTVAIENIIDGNRVLINFKSKTGKTTNGYIPWYALKPY